MRPRLRSRRGVSEVISTVILTAVVMTIGTSIWFYAQSATSVMTNTYVNETFSTMKEVLERFTVEHVSNNTARTALYVWVYNYGEVDVEVDVYATIDGETYSSDVNNPLSIGSGGFAKATLTISASSGDEVAIKVHSRRQNNAYYTFYMP